jgi:hypothetical protein
MDARVVDASDPGWTRALSAIAHDAYHRADYMAEEAKRFDAVAEAFVATDGERSLFLPYLVRSCAELGPGAAGLQDLTSPQGYAGPILSPAGHDRTFVAAALDALRAAMRERGRVSGFFRMHPILGQDDPTLYPSELLADHGKSIAIDLRGDEADLLAQVKDTQREAIRRCRRLGYEATFEPLADVVDAFHAPYAATMARVRATDAYRFPAEYFATLATRPDVHACVVRQGDAIAAGCLFFEYGGILQAHLGGTFDAHLPASPFVLALHEASRWGQRRGNRWLHLGGGVGGANDGVLRFKASLGRGRFMLRSLRVIADQQAYDRLVALSAVGADTGSPDFFPAYRAAPRASRSDVAGTLVGAASVAIRSVAHAS